MLQWWRACLQLWLHQTIWFVASMSLNFHGYMRYRSVTIIRIISNVGTYVRVCWVMMTHWKFGYTRYLLLSFEIILWKEIYIALYYTMCDVSCGGTARIVVVSCELLLTDCHPTLSYRDCEHGKTTNWVFLGQVKVRF